MLNIRVKAAQRLFFDRAAVLKSADKKTRSVLSRFGAFLRRTAKGLVGRKGKRPSRPGSPPRKILGLIGRFLYFHYDPARRSVITGPAKLSRTVGGNELEVLEKGGSSKVATGKAGHRRTKTVRIAARPYMGPAAAKELPKVPAMWAAAARQN